MIIRSAIKRDVRKINDLFHEQLPDSYAEYHEMNLPPHKPAGEFQWGSRNHFAAVAYETQGYRSVMIGAAYMAPRVETAFDKNWGEGLLGRIENIAVVPEYRNQGVGHRLIGLCENFARSQGWDKLALTVKRDNTPGIRFYLREGFIFGAYQSGKLFVMVKYLGE